MNTILMWASAGLCAYLLGAIPFGFLLARAAGVDIRTVGSGNIGATNVYRSVSKKLGLLTFLLDFLKGVVASTLIAGISLRLFAGQEQIAGSLALFCGVMAVVGHSWTCFLGFKGGKGVATSAGMLVGVAWLAFVIAFAVWLVVLLTVKYMSIASSCGAVALLAAAWLLPQPSSPLICGVLSVLAILVIWRHKSNFKRLAAGTEPHFTFKKG